jgi:hypothetical protein
VSWTRDIRVIFYSTGLAVVKEVEEDDQSNNHQDQQILSGIGSTFVGITGPCGFHGPLFLFHLFELLANGSIDTGMMMIGSLENLSSPTRNIKQSWKFRMIIQFLFFSSDKGHTHTPSRSAHALSWMEKASRMIADKGGGSVVSLNGFNGACSVRQKRAKMIRGEN